MKKLLALILSGALVVSSLAGCSGGSSGTATPTPAPADTSGAGRYLRPRRRR